jgi:hypothetical protein
MTVAFPKSAKPFFDFMVEIWDVDSNAHYQRWKDANCAALQCGAIATGKYMSAKTGKYMSAKAVHDSLPWEIWQFPADKTLVAIAPSGAAVKVLA